MNIFNKILEDYYANDTRLGCPSKDYAAQRRRMNAMATMTMSNGFSIPPKGRKLSKGGKTRTELEAAGKAIFERNLAAEVSFREAHANQPGWGIRRINAAIEKRLHLKPSATQGRE
ncbi:hypothetical protein LRP31_25610 [Mesorhizobium mediterraneum]|uniref:Uncharacterized protein n=1 Tax=Mesorhizobium mediterraneum TaxID=43617 RepID=A0AB36RFU4_9HYPH|nr:hypothetical protein [Mesorhizobium mediterraneum]PAQ03702.1 hypothetical protein CIT25_04080 [Mesorhizobium mediterraneum]WIW52400.1 hypothetical protein LRP31_25610 [Mesorhizobium mediterraneum]